MGHGELSLSLPLKLLERVVSLIPTPLMLRYTHVREAGLMNVVHIPTMGSESSNQIAKSM